MRYKFMIDIDISGRDIILIFLSPNNITKFHFDNNLRWGVKYR